MVQHPYMYFLIISVTREQKHSLVMGSWVSKCGFRIPNMFQRTRRDSIRMLYPKRTKFRKCQKGKCRGCRTDGTRLSFGEYGIKSCSAGRIPYQTIEAARRAISRHFQRNGRIWVRIFADIPITRKPTEVRMGKGKGNSTGWMARVVTGQILFEMDGVSLSNAREAATLAAHRPCVPTKFVQWL